MKVTTQSHLKDLSKPKTVDAGKTLCREVRGTHNHGEDSNVPRGSLAATPACSPQIQMMTSVNIPSFADLIYISGQLLVQTNLWNRPPSRMLLTEL